MINRSRHHVSIAPIVVLLLQLRFLAEILCLCGRGNPFYEGHDEQLCEFCMVYHSVAESLLLPL